MNLANRFLDKLPAGDKTVAIREANGTTTSRGELRRQVVGLQHALKEQGFQRGDLAVLQAPSGAALAATTMAVAMLGGVSLLAEPGLGDDVYTKRIVAAKPKWVIVHPIVQWANRIPGARSLLARREIMVPPTLSARDGVKTIRVSSKILKRLAADEGAEPIVEAMGPRDDLVVIYTGGTTSLPKGVRLSHGSVNQILTNIEAIASGTGAQSLVADNPQQVIFGLVLGIEVLVTSGRVQRRAETVRSLIDSGRAEAYFGSPFVWMEMMEQAGPDKKRLPPSLKAVMLGGAPVTPEFLKSLRGWLDPSTQVTVIYGLTEAGPVATASAADKIEWTGTGDYLGTLMPGTAAKISESGEIVLNGPSLFNGYLGQEELPADGDFATGDLGEIIEHDGRSALVLVGRAKDMIIRAAVNIYPATLEADLHEIADGQGRKLLRDVALIGLWDDEKQDEAVVLCWQPAAGIDASETHIARAAFAVTGTSAKPDFMLKCDPMPVRGRLNKVDKVELRARAAAQFGLSAVPRSQRD